MPIYDFTLHERSAEVRRVEPADVVIVEGILVLHIEEIRSLLNMKIFVDTDDDLRLARRCAAAQALPGRLASHPKSVGLMEAQLGSSVKHSMWLKLRLMARCSQGKHRGLSEASFALAEGHSAETCVSVVQNTAGRGTEGEGHCRCH